MSIVTLIGDGTTTTALAVASGWPEPERPVVVEADPSGGSLAAWLDTPALPSLATAVAQGPRHDPGGSGDTVGSGDSVGSGESGPVSRRTVLDALRPAIQPSSAGISFVAAPTRSIAAARAVEEAAGQIFPALASTEEFVALVDAGRNPGHAPLPAVLRHSAVIVACHRQSPASARAGAVRLERFAEDVARWGSVGRPVVPAVIGAAPFDPDEIAYFLASRADGAPVLAHHLIADDPLAAAVLAGRDGVSARRLHRLPLMRSAAGLAGRICAVLHDQRLATDRRVAAARSAR